MKAHDRCEPAAAISAIAPEAASETTYGQDFARMHTGRRPEARAAQVGQRSLCCGSCAADDYFGWIIFFNSCRCSMARSVTLLSASDWDLRTMSASSFMSVSVLW